jgi:hypothetical protein
VPAAAEIGSSKARSGWLPRRLLPGYDFTPANSDKSSAIKGVLRAIGVERALVPADEQQLLKNG